MNLDGWDGIRITIDKDNGIDQTRRISQTEFEVSREDTRYAFAFAGAVIEELDDLTESKP